MATAVDYIRSSQGQVPAATSGGDQDFLDSAAEAVKRKAERYATYDAYYDGEHATRLNDRTREFLQRNGITWAENFCEPVIDTMAERLALTGFDADRQQVADWIDEVSEANRLDALQDVVHTTALIKGDAYLIADTAPEYPRLVFNRPEIVHCCYADDSAETVLWAAKCWTTDEQGPSNPRGRAVERLNLYMPDRIERWFRVTSGSKGGWQPWRGPDGEAVTPWLMADGEPIGVPVVHFRNRPLGRPHGRSELHGVIPQQDLLNKLVLDLAMILDNQAWRQRWTTGIDPSSVSFKNLPGDVWMATDKDARFGDFQADGAEGPLAAIEGTLSRIARRSRTPLHLLTGGDMPSGEALRTAESGLVAKVGLRQTVFGNSWEDAMRLAMRIETVFGQPPFPPEAEGEKIAATWRDPQSRNEVEEANTALIKQQLGVSKRTLLIEMGYDPDQEAERRAEESVGAQDALAGYLDRGADVGATAQDTPQPA